MILLPEAPVAFGDAGDGDLRHDDNARARFSAALDIGERWAWMRQVHGTRVVRAEQAGDLGEADAMFTTEPGLALAVATADCVPVALVGPHAVGIAHAGWRGAASGVVEALVEAMTEHSVPPMRAFLGPAIGPCCFEVGDEVLALFPDHKATTTWGTPSVDLRGAVGRGINDLEVWVSQVCTMSDAGYHSHRRDGTTQRQVTVAWLPA